MPCRQIDFATTTRPKTASAYPGRLNRAVSRDSLPTSPYLGVRHANNRRTRGSRPLRLRGAADTPPGLTVAKIQDGSLVMEVFKQIPVQKAIDVTVIVNGNPVTEKRTVTVYETVVVMQQVSLKGAKTTRGGKELSEKALADLLTEDTPIVTSQGPLAEKYKKLFKDDVILIEFAAPAPK